MWGEFCEIYSENNSKQKYRAIYKNDIGYKEMPIFELKGEYFVMVGDNEIKYDKEDVFKDDDFIVFGSIDNQNWSVIDIKCAAGYTEGIIAFKKPNPWNIHLEGNKIIIPDNIQGISISFVHGFIKDIFRCQFDEYYEVVGKKELVEKFNKAIYYLGGQYE